jgi:hypothetical protein
MTLSGYVHNGSIVLDPQFALPEGAAVRVEIVEVQPSGEHIAPATNEPPSLLERLGDVVGAIDDLPTDAALNHDHYLYGAPKRS